MPSRLTIGLAIWGSVGPLAGIVVGHFLTRSWQRKQWLLDARKAEFKEVVSAISQTTIEMIHYKEARGTPLEFSHDRWLEAHKIAQRTIHDRIYIAGDLEQINFQERALTLIGKLRDSPDYGESEYATKLDLLIAEVKKIARRG